MINTITLLLAGTHLGLIVLFLGFRSNQFRLYPFKSFFIFSYAVCFYGGILLAGLIENTVGAFRSINYNLVNSVIFYADFGLFAFLIGDLMPVRIKTRLKINQHFLNKNNIRLWGNVCIAASLISIGFYIIVNRGFVLSETLESGYTARYSSNLGLGLVTSFFVLFLIGIVSHYYVTPTKKKLIILLGLSMLYSIIVFMTLGGYRQLGLAAIATLLFLGWQRKQISTALIIVSSVILTILLTLMAYLRYGEIADLSLNIGVAKFLYYILDSVSPFDSFLLVMDRVPKQVNYQYFRLFFGSFTSIIPRFLWTDKPLVVMNAGNFFTQNIKLLSGVLTISPTLLGELFMAGGWIAVFIGMFVTGMILKYIDLYFVSKVKNPILIIYYYAFLFQLTFTLYREGIGSFLSKLIISITLSLVLFVAVLLIPRRSKSSDFHSQNLRD